MQCRLSFLLFILIIFITACFNNEQTANKTQETAQQELKDGEFVKLKETEVKEILKKNINTIFETLEKQVECQQSTYFNIIKPKEISFTTEEFANSTLKSLTAEIYCECGIQFKPNVNYDVHFEYKQYKKDEITLKALDAATEMSNMGIMWEFVLVKEDSTWKMHKWDSQPLEGKDIQLTEEEKILTRNGETPKFVNEYESKQAAGKDYRFNMQSSNGERLVAISSKDTRWVYDFEDNTKDSLNKRIRNQLNQEKNRLIRWKIKKMNQIYTLVLRKNFQKS